MVLRRWKSLAGILSFWRRANARNVIYFTLYVGQITFSTQLLTLNYLICVQLRTEEMEMKGIVTNKKERNRKGVNLLLWYLFCSLFRCKIEDTNCSNNRRLWISQHVFLCLCKDRWCRDSVPKRQEKVNFIISDKNVFWQESKHYSFSRPFGPITTRIRKFRGGVMNLTYILI